jgi:hypothetical protein
MAENVKYWLCQKEIDAEVVWFRPFGEPEPEVGNVFRFTSLASESDGT